MERTSVVELPGGQDLGSLFSDLIRLETELWDLVDAASALRSRSGVVVVRADARDRLHTELSGDRHRRGVVDHHRGDQQTHRPDRERWLVRTFTQPRRRPLIDDRADPCRSATAHRGATHARPTSSASGWVNRCRRASCNASPQRCASCAPTSASNEGAPEHGNDPGHDASRRARRPRPTRRTPRPRDSRFRHRKRVRC